MKETEWTNIVTYTLRKNLDDSINIMVEGQIIILLILSIFSKGNKNQSIEKYNTFCNIFVNPNYFYFVRRFKKVMIVILTLLRHVTGYM